MIHHPQRIAGHQFSRGETALARLQQRVNQGDVRNLVVETEVTCDVPVVLEHPATTRRLSSVVESVSKQSPSKKWQTLRRQTTAHLEGAVRAVHDELTNTSTSAVAASSAGDEGQDNNTLLVVSSSGQPRRHLRREQGLPNGMGPGVVGGTCFYHAFIKRYNLIL